MASNKERIETSKAFVSNIQEEAHTLIETRQCMIEIMHSREEVPQRSSSQTRRIHYEDEVETWRANFSTPIKKKTRIFEIWWSRFYQTNWQRSSVVDALQLEDKVTSEGGVLTQP